MESANRASLAAGALAHQEVAQFGGVFAATVATHEDAHGATVAGRFVADQDTLAEAGSDDGAAGSLHTYMVWRLLTRILLQPGENFMAGFSIAYRPGAQMDTRFAHWYTLDQGDEVRQILGLERTG